MPISSALFRKSVLAVGTAALGLALVAGTGVTSASAAGAITSIKLFANDANFYAGSTHSFTVIGYDADGNAVDETANATLTSDQTDDVITGVTVKLGAPATHIIKASLAAFPTATKGSLALPVVAGPIAGLKVSPAAAGVTLKSVHAFTTQAVDANGYARGTVTASYTSSSTKDRVSGSNISFGSYGTRTITARWTNPADSHHWVGTTTITVLKKLAPKLSISGSYTTGHTLKATISGVSGKGAHVTYQWYVAGVAVSGATSKSFVIPSSAKGHTVKLSYTVTASGYLTYSKSSASHKVAK